jgi:hypothetical protein
LGEISKTHFLYKEDNVNEVKWLEKLEYCRAKGDVSVYRDAGQGKCEYSRGLCYWDGQSCLNTYRDFDNFDECVNLLLNNVLVDGLDNGRLQNPGPVFEPEVEPEVEPVFEPVFESEVEPVFEPEVEPVFEPEVEPVFEPCIHQLTKSTFTSSMTSTLPESTQIVSSDIIFYTSLLNYIYIFII